MNLAIVRWRIAGSGGVERFIFDIARALGARGVEVTLISEPFERRDLFPGRTLELPRMRGSRGRRYRNFQRAVAERLAANAFTLVQSHERLLTADLYRAGDGVHAAWVDRLKRSRPWRRRLGMGLNPMHRLYMETERRMVSETDMIFVANSALVARELGDWLGLAGSRIRLIENGVDLDRFAPAAPEARAAARAALGLEGHGPVLAYVGSGFERKGAFHLIRALAMPELAGVSAIVAGRDKASGALRDLVGRLGLTDRVLVAGQVEDVATVLSAADVFVLPTLYDPMPNAALEALASGLPVVTTADAGIADAVAESGAGRIAERTPEAFAEAITAVLGDLPAAGAAALALRPRLALSAAVEKWLDLYEELT
ncbi:MAG: glycosyltransferase family 4 protein [Alphaproteobacteria bacterium]|nr:glycosyltransferase family 4 protein [Alphaproteobacteria bacterium]